MWINGRLCASPSGAPSPSRRAPCAGPRGGGRGAAQDQQRNQLKAAGIAQTGLRERADLPGEYRRRMCAPLVDGLVGMVTA